MDHALGMRVLERRRHAVRDPYGLGRREAPLGRLVEHPLERAAGHVLAHDVGLAGLLADVVHGHDRRVVAQPGHGLRLGPDPFAGGVVEALRLDERDRHVAVEARVVRAVHALAGALAEIVLHHVAAGGDSGRGVGPAGAVRARCGRRRGRGLAGDLQRGAAAGAEAEVGRIFTAAVGARDLGVEAGAAVPAEVRVVRVRVPALAASHVVEFGRRRKQPTIGHGGCLTVALPLADIAAGEHVVTRLALVVASIENHGTC